MRLRIASFFSGIGGLELGLEAALDADTVFQVERDPYAVGVIERHWPGVSRHDDITQLRGADIPAADLWCGGFPCQDISLAGKGAGLDGARSGLWWAWRRLIGDVGPSLLVVENVAAFAVRGLDAVLGSLAEGGYDAEWSRLSAADVGAPHLRQRLFLIAWRPEQLGALADAGGGRGPHDGLRPGRNELGVGGSADVSDSACSTRRQQPRRGRPELRQGEAAPEPSSDGTSRRLGQAERALQAVAGAGWWAAEPDVGRVAHGVPSRVDRLRCLGNAVVPRCAYLVGLRVRQILGEADHA